MSDQKNDPNGDILRDISDVHEDQPGDLGKTTTEKTDESDEQVQGPQR